MVLVHNGEKFKNFACIELRITGFTFIGTMRPDQHKKKKNSDYKKKHAIPPGRGVNHDKKGSTSKERSDEVHSESKAEHEIDDTVDAQEKKNFSRRKIQSNWDRYKDDEFGKNFI